jgi:hypothetical protein
MGDAINEAELGRSKKSVSPQDHLQHLLGLGWEPSSPLIEKYVLKNRLQAQLSEWQAAAEAAAKEVPAPKLKNRKVAQP